MRKTILDSIQHMASQALRTIGVAYKELPSNIIDSEDKNERGVYGYEKDGYTLVGIFGIRDTIREEVPESIRKCYTAGISVKMVTGDNKITA
jgi:magnesium-transporting ATPase (P-type)